MATAIVSIFALLTLNKNDHLRSLDEPQQQDNPTH